VCTTHVREPFDLPRDDRARFFEDMLHAAQAIERAMQPIKMNYQILGNTIPHLHAHLVPRYYGDPAPGMPINMGQQTLIPSPDEVAARVAHIRAAL
jgi:diadenosine tetraphosphate (Ap4A) HIT family hydrolase